MKPGVQLFKSCLAALVVIAMPAVSAAAEAQVVAQDLMNVRASKKINAAIWTRRQDSYTLQIIPVGTFCRREGNPGGVQLREDAGLEGIDRAAFFIGNTIANLRDLDTACWGGTLTLTDGRRVAPAGQQDAAKVPAQAAPQKLVAAPPAEPPRLRVWLLLADGKQIVPTVVKEETSAAYGCKSPCPVIGKLYRFPMAESAQAVAVAISVDDEYYVEKLRPLEPDAQ